jgi:hypothetical protein
MGSVPLFLISFAIYNMIAFIVPVAWETKLVEVPLQSGATWGITAGDALIALALLFLLFETIKWAGAAARPIFDRLLASVILVAAVVEFLLVPAAATSVFATLLLISFVEVAGGWMATVRAIRRETVYPSERIEPGPG